MQSSRTHIHSTCNPIIPFMYYKHLYVLYNIYKITNILTSFTKKHLPQMSFPISESRIKFIFNQIISIYLILGEGVTFSNSSSMKLLGQRVDVKASETFVSPSNLVYSLRLKPRSDNAADLHATHFCQYLHYLRLLNQI